jgi:8-hydroxy-5-deazaflavin:NADPH oxidoreductase
MNIAILGGGHVGGALGKSWAGRGHAIHFGLRNPADPKYRQLAAGGGLHITLATVAEASKAAEIVVVATPWPAAKQALADASPLAGKIIIDCTNPLKSDLSGLEVGHTTSAAEQIAGWAQGGQVVKTFNHTGAGNMANPGRYPLRPVMFVCGDDAHAKKTVLDLVQDIGFDAIDAGPLTMARELEPLAMLWISLALKQKLGPNIAFALMRAKA